MEVLRRMRAARAASAGTAESKQQRSEAHAGAARRAASGAQQPIAQQPAPSLTRQLLALEYGHPGEFDDPSLEWRRLFAELLGTFLLVLVAGGGSVLHAEGQISLAAAVTAPGLMVMAIILFMGAVSGAHLNPVVSLGFALRGDFPWRRLPGYVIIQLLGALLAALFLNAVLTSGAHAGAHAGAIAPGAGYHDWQAFLVEVVLTAGLVSVILGTASAAQNVGPIAALGVGGYIALSGLWAAPVSGACMNPARWLGPAIAAGGYDGWWLYLAGPLAGTLLAVAFAYILRGRGGSAVSRAAGSGRLEQVLAEQDPVAAEHWPQSDAGPGARAEQAPPPADG